MSRRNPLDGRTGLLRDRWESATVHISGIALVIVAIGMAVSGLVGAIDGGSDRWTDVRAMVGAAAITGTVGVAMWHLTRVPTLQRTAAAFSAVAWSWVTVSLFGALTFLFAGTFDWAHLDDAIFESVSGFTCTGSTVILDLDSVPKGVRFFRQMSQWFGGMGLIVLAVAILPALKVGGLELIAAEAPGPTPDRLTPQVRETAKRLWMLYGGITLLITAALMVIGRMDLYDAVAHAFTTASTGGFSPYGSSAGHFDSVAVELVLVVGMFICGASFAWHWQAVRGNPGVYARSSEFRLYVMALAVVIGGLALFTADLDVSSGQRIRDAVFNATTIVTSTGFGTADFTLWGPAAQVLLLLFMIPAGTTGSTSGGLKLLRVQVAAKFAAREVTRARHPRAVRSVRLGQAVVAPDVVFRTLGFVLLYLTAMLVGGGLVTALGTDPVTGFSAAVSATSNIGPGLGDVGPAATFQELPRLARPVLMALMLFGRLEVFPMVIAVTTLAARVRPRAILSRS